MLWRTFVGCLGRGAGLSGSRSTAGIGSASRGAQRGAGWGLCSEGGFLMRGEREGPRHIRETYRTSELEGVLSAVLCNRH